MFDFKYCYIQKLKSINYSKAGHHCRQLGYCRKVEYYDVDDIAKITSF